MNFGATNYVNSYLVDTDNITDMDLKNAIEYCSTNSSKVGHTQKFGEYHVIHGEILQENFELESLIAKIAQNESTPEIKVFIYE